MFFRTKQMSVPKRAKTKMRTKVPSPEAASETTEEKAPGKDAKTKVKEAFDNIHIPKMPKKDRW